MLTRSRGVAGSCESLQYSKLEYVGKLETSPAFREIDPGAPWRFANRAWNRIPLSDAVDFVSAGVSE